MITGEFAMKHLSARAENPQRRAAVARAETSGLRISPGACVTTVVLFCALVWAGLLIAIA